MHCSDLQRDVEHDPEVRELLEGTEGDPEKVRAKMREMRESRGIDDEAFANTLGSSKPMKVTFRELDPASVYVRPQDV